MAAENPSEYHELEAYLDQVGVGMGVMLGRRLSILIFACFVPPRLSGRSQPIGPSHTFPQALESYYEAKDDPACPFHGWKKSAQGKLVMEPWC